MLITGWREDRGDVADALLTTGSYWLKANLVMIDPAAGSSVTFDGVAHEH